MQSPNRPNTQTNGNKSSVNSHPLVTYQDKKADKGAKKSSKLQTVGAPFKKSSKK